MAVFFNGAFTRGLRRETERRLRRDTIEKAHAHLGVHPFSARAIFSGLGTRRLYQGRGKTQALSEPKSQRIGTSKNNFSSPGNQSRSSVYRGRDTQKKNQPTSGTKSSPATSPSSATNSGSGRTSATRPTRASTGSNIHNKGAKHSHGSRPMNFQRYESAAQGSRLISRRTKRSGRYHSVVG